MERGIAREIVPVIPTAALAQAWRDPRHARLARLVDACSVEALDEPLATTAGELCAKAGVSELIGCFGCRKRCPTRRSRPHR